MVICIMVGLERIELSLNDYESSTFTNMLQSHCLKIIIKLSDTATNRYVSDKMLNDIPSLRRSNYKGE